MNFESRYIFMEVPQKHEKCKLKSFKNEKETLQKLSVTVWTAMKRTCGPEMECSGPASFKMNAFAFFY